MQDRPRHGEPLHHAAREIADGLVGTPLHPDGRDHLLDAGATGAMERGVVAEILPPAQLPVEEGLVTQVANPSGHLPALAGEVGAEDARAAAVRAQKAREHAQQRRLAGSVRAQHRERGAARDADGDAGECEALAVTALETVELDRRFHGGEAYAALVPRLVGINHLVLEVTDLEAALDFYASVFDFELRGRVRGMAFIDMGDQFLVLAEDRNPEPPDRERHFGLVVDDRDAVRRRLEEVGAELLPGRGLDFRDPWGNRVQVVEYGQIQFSKTESVLRGMGLEGLEKSERTLAELRDKGLS